MPHNEPMFSSLFDDENPEAIAQRINDRSDELFQEFFGLLEDARIEDPKVNERSVFEAWVVQKLASLQVLQEDFNERVNLIASHTRKR